MSMKETQRDTFLETEGDGYFKRNEAALARTDGARNLVVQRIAHHLQKLPRAAVLEVGCATGGNLTALASLRPIDAFGIDPSPAAISAGGREQPGLKLQVGTADELNFPDASFDVVWFGFCLYLVDRGLLHRAVAECDRVLREGGIVAIHDFDPDQPSVRPYRHHAGLNSYKMDYSRLFLANPAYSLLEKVSFTHHDLHWSADPQERVGLWLCRKSVESAYRSI
jgi:SAM-dependent methyltransferase